MPFQHYMLCNLLTFPTSILKICSRIYFQCKESQWPLTTWAFLAAQAPGGNNSRMLLFSIWTCYQNAIRDSSACVFMSSFFFLCSNRGIPIHVLPSPATLPLHRCHLRGKMENREQNMRDLLSFRSNFCLQQPKHLGVAGKSKSDTGVWHKLMNYIEHS